MSKTMKIIATGRSAPGSARAAPGSGRCRTRTGADLASVGAAGRQQLRRHEAERREERPPRTSSARSGRYWPMRRQRSGGGRSGLARRACRAGGGCCSTPRTRCRRRCVTPTDGRRLRAEVAHHDHRDDRLGLVGLGRAAAAWPGARLLGDDLLDLDDARSGSGGRRARSAIALDLEPGPVEQAGVVGRAAPCRRS